MYTFKAIFFNIVVFKGVPFIGITSRFPFSNLCYDLKKHTCICILMLMLALKIGLCCPFLNLIFYFTCFKNLSFN